MTSIAQRRPIARSAGAALGVALSLMVGATAMVVAEEPADASLCDAISVEDLNALGSLRFDAPMFGTASSCLFESSSGSDTLTLVLSGISFELMRSSSPDLVEVMVGDRPAVAMDGFLHVGMDDGILSVILESTDPEGVAGLDPVQYSVDVAEIVVPALEAAALARAEPSSGSSLLPPPEVAGIRWGRDQDVVSGTELMEAGEGQAAIWQPLLDAVGADATQLFSINVSASDPETDERIGIYSAIQLSGVDESKLRSVFIDWFRAASGSDDVAAEDVTLGGKAVTKLSVDGEFQAYLYHDGDVIHALTMPEEDAARVLEVLP